jgi:hypothetical protein
MAFARGAQDRATEMQRGADAAKVRLIEIKAETRAARKRLDSRTEQDRTQAPAGPRLG